MTLLTRCTFLTAALGTLGGTTLAMSALADGHATNHTILIKGFAFEPANLTISVGDTVTFVNEDSAPHTATSDNGTFDTGRLNRGASAALNFATTGNYSYFCQFHQNMKANITVTS
jgi:plastocyanin